MPDPAISLKNVNLTLGAGAVRVEILKNLSLDIAAGASVALLGPSGSGKSSLLMAMAGLEAINAGEIFVDGAKISAMNEDQLARFRGRTLGVVFQSFHLIPTLTALENVALPLEFLGEADIFARAGRALDEVGLGARKSHYPTALSGGEQQRVAIARALVARPKVIFADEPTGNLDSRIGGEIAELIFSACARHAATLVLVTHDEALARRCGRIIRLRNGEIDSDSARAESARAEAGARP